MSKFRYLVLGSGMQGGACGYYFSQFGDAKEIGMADISMDVAKKAAERVNSLSSSTLANAIQIDAKNHASLVQTFKNYDAALSAIDYSLNVDITKAAIEAGVHLVDLGGNTDIVKAQLQLNDAAKTKDVSIVPDCGLAPGLGNTLAAYGMEMLDETEDVQIRCGGLAQEPRPPLDYKLVFSIRGLTNEYLGKAWILRDSKVVEIDTFSELESIDFEAPVGRCEAFVTTGGSSTCPWTFENKVKTYEYKTVRYPGHYDKFKCMVDLGLLDLEPVEVNGVSVVPREVFHKLAPAKLDFPGDKDLVVLRTTCVGKKSGKRRAYQFDLILFQDEDTGFTAMEMGTGYPAALVLIHAARGQTPKGVVSLEKALNHDIYIQELIKNALPIRTTEL